MLSIVTVLSRGVVPVTCILFPQNPKNPTKSRFRFFINTIITCEEGVQFLPKNLAIKG
jgi:hypothetical protein